jgi:hypothetical protein
MPTEELADLEHKSLQELLDAYTTAKLEKRETDMARLNSEIDKRRARGEQA